MTQLLFNNLILELDIKYWIPSKYLADYSVLMDNQTWSLNTIPRLHSQFSVNKDCIHASVYLHLYACTSKRRVSLLPKVYFFCILIQVRATVKTCSSSPKKEITFWYSWHVGGAILHISIVVLLASYDIPFCKYSNIFKHLSRGYRDWEQE